MPTENVRDIDAGRTVQESIAQQELRLRNMATEELIREARARTYLSTLEAEMLRRMEEHRGR